jgi:hypothetical protein
MNSNGGKFILPKKIIRPYLLEDLEVFLIFSSAP